MHLNGEDMHDVCRLRALLHKHRRSVLAQLFNYLPRNVHYTSLLARDGGYGTNRARVLAHGDEGGGCRGSRKYEIPNARLARVKERRIKCASAR